MKTYQPTYACRVAWLAVLLVVALRAWGEDRMISMGDSIAPVPFSEFVATGLRVMEIETVNGEWPTCDYISSPSNAWGKSIANATKVPGRLRLHGKSGVLYDSGDYLSGVKGMTVRIRGNSSAYAKVKPYKIDLQDKADLLMRNNPSYRDKDWALIRDVYQEYMLGFEVNKSLGLQWTPGYGYVHLIFNGEYLGIYMLVETVKRNTNCRLNVSKSGFIFEHDSYWWTTDYSIPSVLYSMMRYTFKYPNEEDLTADDKAYMERRIKDYETSVLDGTYPSQIDVESMARWALGHDILGLNDAAGSNRFFTIYDRNSKIMAGNMWDFGSVGQSPGIWSRSHRILLKNFFNSENRAFVRAFVEAWRGMSGGFVKQMNDMFNRAKTSEQGKALQYGAYLEDRRWEHSNQFYYNIVNLMEWITARKQWLDKQMQLLNPPGDVNYDARVDVEDVNAIINIILGGDEMPTADVTGDGRIDVEDVNAVINIILK
ncbi:MAG: CotH kinase family protein [Muribaculaceae bacterium]|nr:CotH kinase family protein [Muribaculaceae bacterium]